MNAEDFIKAVSLVADITRCKCCDPRSYGRSMQDSDGLVMELQALLDKEPGQESPPSMTHADEALSTLPGYDSLGQEQEVKKRLVYGKSGCQCNGCTLGEVWCDGVEETDND